MRIILITTFICYFSNCPLQAQDYSLPKFEDNIKEYYWMDEDSSSQIELWENGKVKTNYESIDDRLKWRFDYNENGTLKFKFKVYQEYEVDTSVVIDLETYEETIILSRGYTDVPHGIFEGYHYNRRSKKALLKTSGQYSDGLRKGEWYYRNFKGSTFTTKVNYRKGRLSGESIEYYSSNTFEGEKVKYKGNYDVIRLNKKSGMYGHTRRVGAWKYYDRSGELLETVTYKQEQDKK